MTLPKDLQKLLVAAGRARADERDRLKRVRQEDEAKRAAQIAGQARAGAAVHANAEVVWSWVTSSEGDDLRAAMRAQGLVTARLGVLGIYHGEWRRRQERGFGSVAFDVLADAVGLHVDIIRGYRDNRSGRVISVTELAHFAPDFALDSLAGEIRAGRALELLRAFLPLTPLLGVEVIR